MHIEQLQLEIKRAVDEAYERGFREGSQSVAASIMQAAQAVTSGVLPSEFPASPTADIVVTLPSENGESDKMVLVELKRSGKRAPRGLTKTVVRQVLADGAALPMADVQRRAKAIDGRISEKTVYNELYREPEYWKDNRNRWTLLNEDEVAAVRARQLGMTEELLRNLNLTDAPKEREKEEAPIVH